MRLKCCKGMSQVKTGRGGTGRRGQVREKVGDKLGGRLFWSLSLASLLGKLRQTDSNQSTCQPTRRKWALLQAMTRPLWYTTLAQNRQMGSEATSALSDNRRIKGLSHRDDEKSRRCDKGKSYPVVGVVPRTASFDGRLFPTLSSFQLLNLPYSFHTRRSLPAIDWAIRSSRFISRAREPDVAS
jgi:hypothetical protein